MKEKYIFFTLLIVAAGMLLSSAAGRKSKGEISAEERVLENKLRQAQKRQFALPPEINIDRIQNLVAFSYYEGMLRRSPFFQAQPREGTAGAASSAVALLEETAPKFIYKGKMVLGERLVVLIEQTRLDEVVMVSQGDNIAGYKVLDITDTEVILSKEGEEDIVLNTVERPQL